MPKLNVLIAGSTGYIGVQLIKLLIKHKNINIKYLCGNSSVGKKISFYDASLKSKKLPRITKYNKKYLSYVDIIFTALPNGEAQLISKDLLKKNTLIDLAADFRLKKGSDYLNKVFDILGPERREVLLEKLNHQYPHAISLPPLIPHKIHLQTENLLIHKDIRENYSKDECENIMKIKCFVASIDKTYLSDGVSKDEHSNLRTSEEELGLNQGYCENYLKTIHKDHQSSINANQKQYLFKTKTFFLPNIVWLIIWMFYVYLGFFGPAPWWTGVIALIGFSAMISNASKDVDDPNFKTVDTNE